jgi:biopolymer transport protein TolR
MRKRKKQLAEINVVPYIDVMLVLLVIFMITAPLLSQGVKVDLPQAAAQALSTKMPEPIIVSVDAQGNYYLNIAANSAAPITPRELEAAVSTSLKADKTSGEHRQVLVKGDKNVDYGKVVQAMVILQNAGAESVGLMTQGDDTVTPSPKKISLDPS